LNGKEGGKTMLVVNAINSFYGKAHILTDLSLKMEKGQVGVLLGRNGAGKSTTLKSIMGIVSPKSGEIFFNGKPLVGLPPYKICAMGLGYVPEDRRIFTGLTIMENLEAGRRAARQGRGAWTVERLFELFPNLAEIKDRLGGRISGGEQQMLTIARTLMGNPEMMMLDEPSEGLAPLIVHRLSATVKRLESEGVSILLAEQNVNFARAVGDVAFVIERGSITLNSAGLDLPDQQCETGLDL
jgi:branched-chain amino acid transport system ATP-binding protein